MATEPIKSIPSPMHKLLNDRKIFEVLYIYIYIK